MSHLLAPSTTMALTPQGGQVRFQKDGQFKLSDNERNLKNENTDNILWEEIPNISIERFAGKIQRQRLGHMRDVGILDQAFASNH